MRKSAPSAYVVWACFTLISWGSARSVDMIGDYRLSDGTLSNQYAGPGALNALTVTQNGGTAGFGPSGWSWSDAASPGTGLNLANIPGPVSTAYSIGITAWVGETTGFRKLIDFKNQTVDAGFYVNSEQFRFYNLTQGGGSVAAFVPFTIVLTRDGAKNVNVYLNGAVTPILSFVDSGDLAVASTGVLKFFQDDTSVSGEYAAMGSANLIRIWNGALSASQVAGAMTVPEPSTWMLGTLSLTVMIMAARRRAVVN